MFLLPQYILLFPIVFVYKFILFLSLMHLYLLLTYVNMLSINRSIESICTIMQCYVHVCIITQYCLISICYSILLFVLNVYHCLRIFELNAATQIHNYGLQCCDTVQSGTLATDTVPKFKTVPICNFKSMIISILHFKLRGISVKSRLNLV